MMAHRGPAFDPHSNDSTLLTGTKLPRSTGGNIKDKISLWEGKDSHSPLASGTLGRCSGMKRTDSLIKGNNKTTEKQSAESCRRAAHKETQDFGKENAEKAGDLRPCSPAEPVKQCRDDNGCTSKDDCNKKAVVHKEKHNNDKENLENLGDSRPCSPSVTEKQGTLRKDKRAAEQTRQEKRAVFTLFKKLEAMGENHGKTPPELGNYFSPPVRDKQADVKKRESEESECESSGVREGKEIQENVYTEPGAPPINPVPKPRRTFQHPALTPLVKNQGEGRGRRNLPPLPLISSKTTSKPPSGFYGRPRAERVRDNINRYN